MSFFGLSDDAKVNPILLGALSILVFLVSSLVTIVIMFYCMQWSQSSQGVEQPVTQQEDPKIRALKAYTVATTSAPGELDARVKSIDAVEATLPPKSNAEEDAQKQALENWQQQHQTQP